MEVDEVKKGVKSRIIGVVLIFLGALNCMLSWRGGLFTSKFYVWLFIAGIVFYAIGVMRTNAVIDADRYPQR